MDYCKFEWNFAVMKWLFHTFSLKVTIVFEPTCAICMVGSYASFSVCLDWNKKIVHVYSYLGAIISRCVHNVKLHFFSCSTEKSMAQISLKWLLQKPYIPSVVIGARTMAQFTDNMAAAGDWTLSQEEVSSFVSPPLHMHARLIHMHHILLL